MPHEHAFKGREGRGGLRWHPLLLSVLAITLHNVPEGLAVGVSYAGENARLGLPVALGIGIQNLSEGLVIAVALCGHEREATTGLMLGFALALVV
ncbi:MAG TPA: ZIP family metal transporter, partial [Myxococcaceae bacterium]|nr:ZIP family metal transporter [Myxococcaceae bacterium]